MGKNWAPGVCDYCGDQQEEVCRATAEFSFCRGCLEGPQCKSKNINPGNRFPPDCRQRVGHNGKCGESIFGDTWEKE